MASLGPESQPGLIFNASEDLRKGESFIIFLGGLPIAYTKSDDSKLTPSHDDVSSKTSGKYDEKIVGKIEWSYAVEALVSKKKGHLSYEALEQLSASGTPVKFEYCEATVADNGGVKTVTKGAVKRQGMVIVGEVGKKSSRGEYETCSVTLQGSGPLKDGAGNEIGSSEALQALGISLQK